MRRSSLTWLLGLTYTAGVSSLVIPPKNIERKTDGLFNSVKTRLPYDHNWYRTDQPTKHFHEATFSNHYDGRFGDVELDYASRQSALKSLVRSYLQTMASIDAETWIVHGTLIGWWWNQKILPWDSDIDVMVREDTMAHLANNYNLTVHDYHIPETTQNRKYMLEINPHYKDAEADSDNKIDGRWIDTETGLYIDITTAYLQPRVAGEESAMLLSRDGHVFREDDVFPLRDGDFEGTPVQVPRAYEKLLRAEYGADVMTKTTFQRHRFDSVTSEWVPTSTAARRKYVLDGKHGLEVVEKQQQQMQQRGSDSLDESWGPVSSIAAPESEAARRNAGCAEHMQPGNRPSTSAVHSDVDDESQW